MADATRIYTSSGPFEMWLGGELSVLEVAYETWGELNAAADNAVLLFSGLSPSAHAASSRENPEPGWWEEMIGDGKPIDTGRFFVIDVNSVGSCFGSSGPASIDPQTGAPYRLTFPRLSIEDIARAGHDVVSSLGIDRLNAVVGPSMGGMSALAYVLLFPDGAAGLVDISAGVHARPSAIAFRSLQREIIRSDPAWNGGDYKPPGPVAGMRLARKLGMITYRSPAEWRQRFGRRRIDVSQRDEAHFANEFEIESYLEAHGQKFTGSFDANCYLYLSRAMDAFDAADHGSSVEDAFGNTNLERVLIIGVETDVLFPIEQQQELAALLDAPSRDVRFVALSSLQGHDSFLVDFERFGPVIAEFFG
ncbi:MAG: homoserine O-acetyltransferase [Gammaproteobacteria bacterium]